MLRTVTLFAAALAALAVVAGPAVGGGKSDGSNSPNAKSCQKDGWRTLARSTSPTVAFTSETECTSYAAKKGNRIVALQRSLGVTRGGRGTGTVTSNPTGVDCGLDCSESFDQGTSVTLTATPGSSSTFSGWSGDCTGTGTCTVTMDQARSVEATFAVVQYPLTVSRLGDGSGTVTSSPGGIDCGVDCSESYDDGTPVTLSAAAASGSEFAGWSGACSGVGACTVTMSQATSVTATFAQAPTE